MADNQLLVLQEAQAVVTDLLLNKLSKNIKFHTLQHTREVVAACETLANYYQIGEEDRFALLLAAWFHDTGYTHGEAKGHETVSIELANEFMKSRQLAEEVKIKVTGCINATRMPQKPATLIEKIICDADLFHLGTEKFDEKNKLLREELNDFAGNNVSKKDWRKINIRFLENHQYFTDYGKEKLQPVKDKHLSELQEKEEKNQPTMKPEKKEKKEKIKDPVAEAAAAEAKLKAQKEKEADRSIATVFRIMAQSHTGLSQMADSKANILISVNSIILSILIGSLIDKLQTDTNLQIPLGIISIVCVSSIVFGILATRPNVTHGTFTRDDIANKKTNLLFFGNYHNMNLDDYNWGMTEMLSDKVYMNASMIKDQYFLGVVLAKKYRYLRIAYNIFMFGLIISVLAFVVAFLLPGATEVYTTGS
ncbi:MAG TPA: Pycsar system effector family protein [Chitinophagaceae bacterium]|nr:Pycsar system effector family protein [Chitinophagaceae bacterium]